jgi:hypothetical protein
VPHNVVFTAGLNPKAEGTSTENVLWSGHGPSLTRFEPNLLSAKGPLAGSGGKLDEVAHRKFPLAGNGGVK